MFLSWFGLLVSEENLHILKPLLKRRATWRISIFEEDNPFLCFDVNSEGTQKPHL